VYMVLLQLVLGQQNRQSTVVPDISRAVHQMCGYENDWWFRDYISTLCASHGHGIDEFNFARLKRHCCFPPARCVERDLYFACQYTSTG